jgi:hypothetical protein
MAKRPINPEEITELLNLIEDIQEVVGECINQNRRIEPEELQDFIDRLRDEVYISYTYDEDSYPDLVYFGPNVNRLRGEPRSLAELFIWKLNRWTSYRNFVGHYFHSNLEDAPEDYIVHFAFAQHLWSEGKLPIFDQHSCRGLWAIMYNKHSDHWAPYYDYLFKTDGSEWRPESQKTRDSARNCYFAFLKHIKLVARQKDYKKLDGLLMPLGKALKDHCNNLSGFLMYVDNQ